MDKELQEKFLEYENLKINIKKGEERIKELQPILIDLIPEGKPADGRMGVFSVRNISKWAYTDKVKQTKKQLDQLKKDERSTGDAIETLVPTLYFDTYKEE